MSIVQTSTAKLLAKRLTRSTIPLRANALAARLVKQVLGKPVTSASEINVGTMNRVFRVVTPQQTVILRAQFYRDYTKHYQREWERMEVARQLGVLVPATLAIGRWRTHSYMIQEFIRGRDISDLNTLKSWQELGRIARKLSSRPWPTTPQKWNDFVEKVLSTVAVGDIIVKSRTLTREEFDEAMSVVAEMAALRADRVFQHGDLKPENILIDNRGRYWLLDWSSAGGYPHDYALAKVYSCAKEEREFKAFRHGFGMSEEEWDRKQPEMRPLIISVLLQKIFWHLQSSRDSDDLEMYVSRLRSVL